MLKRWRIRILLFLAVLGPGFITANVDNDSGGILTYSQAGAQYGYMLLWTIIPITIALIVVQEMCARMGVVTGKGLSDLIREEFGLRLTFILMVMLVVVNYTNVVTEFIGIAGSLHLFHVTKFISVPLCAGLVWYMVVKGSYKSTEKIFIVASVVYICYIFAGVLSQPSWHEALEATVTLPPRSVWGDKAYMYMAIGVVGTTIAPWMQFYLQSSIVEKGIRVKDYAASRLDVIVGSLFTDIVAWFIIVACAATLFVHGMGAIQTASDAAEAMRPLAGDYAFLLFAFGLFNASVFAASILPISTAYTVCEGLRRGALFLLALYAADCGRRGHRADLARRAVDQLRHSLAGAQRRTAASGDYPDVDAHQPPGLDGRAQEHAAMERDRLGHQPDRHRHDTGDAVGLEAGALRTTCGGAIGLQLEARIISSLIPRKKSRDRF
jgi:NRAMP (natural resistance-associated macrophage protein)-like metal ion transporter